MTAKSLSFKNFKKKKKKGLRETNSCNTGTKTKVLQDYFFKILINKLSFEFFLCLDLILER